MEIIKLKDKVTLNQGVTPDEAEPIKEQIKDLLKKEQEVTLDFSGMGLVTTAFLNVLIGTLYKDFSVAFIKEHLHPEGMTKEIAVRIKKVASNAKAFYENERKFENCVEEVMHGNKND